MYKRQHQALAQLHATLGNRTQAFESAQRAVDTAERYAASPQPNDTRTGHLARSYLVQAIVQSRFGEQKATRESAARAVALWRQVHNAGVLALHRGAIEQADVLARNDQPPR